MGKKINTLDSTMTIEQCEALYKSGQAVVCRAGQVLGVIRNLTANGIRLMACSRALRKC